MVKIRIKWGLLFLLVISILAFFYYRRKPSNVMVHPSRGSIVEAVYGLGTVTSNQIYQLKLGVTATISKVYVKEGDNIPAQTPLLLLTDGRTFSSPFSGTVTEVPFHDGESVFSNTSLITMMNLHDRYVLVSLEQQSAVKVKQGQKVRLSFENLRQEKISGTVKSVFPNNGEFWIRIETEALPDEVLPGMTADVAIEIAAKENALLIPVAAVKQGKVNVVRHGKKVALDAKIGLVDGVMAETLSDDLKIEDTLVVPDL